MKPNGPGQSAWLFAAGPKDLADAAGVIEVSGDAIDWALLDRLCARYGPETVDRLKELRPGL